MDIQHTIVSELKRIASELGRAPTAHEFQKATQLSKHKIVGAFGSFSAALHAAGFVSNRGKQAKIDNSIFNSNIETHISEFVPTADLEPFRITKKDAKIAIISDIHWPFSSKKVLETFYVFIKEHQPDFVIINGDAWDMYSHSKYPRSSNVFTPRDEQSLARKMNEEFWTEVKKNCPNADCWQLLGNHDIRPLRRVLELYPEAEDWITEKLKSLFTFDGVKTIEDHRQELYINQDAIFHGYRTQLGSHRDYTGMNCHVGHTHLGGTVFKRVKNVTIFESNSGVAGDLESKGLTYTPQKATHQTPGFSFRDKWGPRFIAV